MIRHASRVAAPAAVMALVLAGCGTTGRSGSATATPSTPPAHTSSASPSLVAKADLAPCPTVTPAPPGTKGPSLPTVTLPCLGRGPDVPLAALRGPLVVNIWATWCGPCRHEAPLFQRLHARAGKRVPVLGIDYQDAGRNTALSFAIQRKLQYPSVFDADGESKSALGGSPGLPVTLFVDRAGRITFRKVGPYASYAALATAVHEHLGVRP